MDVSRIKAGGGRRRRLIRFTVHLGVHLRKLVELQAGLVEFGERRASPPGRLEAVRRLQNDVALAQERVPLIRRQLHQEGSITCDVHAYIHNIRINNSHKHIEEYLHQVRLDAIIMRFASGSSRELIG